MSRRRTVAAVGLLVLVAGVALGPKVCFSETWVEPRLPLDLDVWIDSVESRVPGIRDGDGRGIVWADPATRSRTSVSIVYLHGFSADRHEVEPVVTDLAAELGANVYFTRLAGHGRDGAAMGEATVDAWFVDVAEAIAIGRRLGDRVVLVGTSTGGTLAVWAAGRAEAQAGLAAMVLVSPNFHPKDRSSRVLLYPWGQQLARLVVGAERCFIPENERQARHWTTCYPTAALATMMALVEHVRTMDAETIRVPTLVLYSPSDAVVDAAETGVFVAAMSGADVRSQVIDGTSDPAHHVLAGDIVSPESNREVQAAILDFLHSVLALPPPDGQGGVP